MMNEKVILTLLLMGYDEREGNTHFITHGI